MWIGTVWISEYKNCTKIYRKKKGEVIFQGEKYKKIYDILKKWSVLKMVINYYVFVTSCF